MKQSPKGPKKNRKGVKQKRRPKLKDKKQSARFIEAARELGADTSSEHFDAVLGRMAVVKPQPSKPKKSAH
jgi:hypothetical protein